MITEQQYLNAIEIIKEYHNQIEEIKNLISVKKEPNLKLIKRVKCMTLNSGGHYLDFLTLGKEYDVIHDSFKTNYRSKEYNNRTYFCIIDDNSKKRRYKYDNPSGVWEFIW